MKNRIQLLEQAQEKLNEVIDMLEVAVQGDRNAEAYLVDHLRIFATENHGFVNSDLNIDNVITKYHENKNGDEDISDDDVECFEEY